MSAITQPVSGSKSNVSYYTPVKKESQLFVKDNELVYRVQEGDTLEKIAEKIKSPFLWSILFRSNDESVRRFVYAMDKKEILVKTLKDYNDLPDSSQLKKGDLIYIPLIGDQINFERLMDQPNPGAQLEATKNAPQILEKLHQIMPCVLKEIGEENWEQEIKKIKEEIIDFIYGSAFDISDEEIQQKIKADIARAGELRAEETFSFLVGLFESDSKRITPAIRWTIINAFSSIGSDICVQYLIYLFESKEKHINPSIMLSSIDALGRCHNPLVLNFLKRMATGEYKIHGYLTWGQDSAIDALGEFYERTKNPEAIKILHQLLLNNNHEVRLWTVNVLGKVGGQKEKDLLLKIIQSKTEENYVKNAAREAVQKIEERL